MDVAQRRQHCRDMMDEIEFVLDIDGTGNSAVPITMLWRMEMQTRAAQPLKFPNYVRGQPLKFLKKAGVYL